MLKERVSTVKEAKEMRGDLSMLISCRMLKPIAMRPLGDCKQCKYFGGMTMATAERDGFMAEYDIICLLPHRIRVVNMFTQRACLRHDRGRDDARCNCVGIGGQ